MTNTNKPLPITAPSRIGYVQHTFNQGRDSEFKVWLPDAERATALRAAFSRVANKKNWKYAINKKLWLTEQEAADIAEGVEFVGGCLCEYWAGTPEIREGKQYYQFIATGYYHAVGA